MLRKLIPFVIATVAALPARASSEKEAPTPTPEATVPSKLTTLAQSTPAGEPPLVPLSTIQRRDTALDDLTCRLSLQYDAGFAGLKYSKVETGEEGRPGKVSTNPQSVNMKLDLGPKNYYDLYLVLGGSVAGYDRASSPELRPNFSALRNNLNLGLGYTINRWYRAEVDGILVRHGEVLPGIRARLVGDLYDAGYGIMESVDFHAGFNLIEQLPHLAAEGGFSFQEHYRIGAGLSYGPKEGRDEVSIEGNFTLSNDWNLFIAGIGAKVFYHRVEEGGEGGGMLTLRFDVKKMPRL